MGDANMSRFSQDFYITLWVSLIYFLLGIIGHTMAIPPGVATPVWPASGFALAMVLIRGRKVWLGIFIGAFITTIEPLILDNTSTSFTLEIMGAGLGIALGSLLQPLFGAWLINRFLSKNLVESANTFLLFALAIPIICIVSSSIGTTSLYINDLITIEKVIETWLTWWLGDTTGIVLITPLMLSWISIKRKERPKITLTLIALYFILILTTLLSFGLFFEMNQHYPLAFLPLPILLIFALNYQVVHTSCATIVVSIIAIVLTNYGFGPFRFDNTNSSLLLLQTFIIVISVTSMSIVALSELQRQTKLKLITENKKRVKNELDLVRLKDNLETQVSERTRELAEELLNSHKKDQQLLQQSRLAQMGEMISMIAHQWRQPLSAITAASSSMKINIALNQYSSEGFQKRLDAIINSACHLSDTINDFRNFYKPNKALVNIILESVVQKALSIIEASLEQDSIKIEHINNSNVPIKVYDNEIVQVILNIIKNAQDNFKEQSITDPHIKIITYERSIRISDNGGGIPKEIKHNIFDPYFSTKNEKNGTGLGLYMSKTIIEKHHRGRLTTETLEGGASFLIEL